MNKAIQNVAIVVVGVILADWVRGFMSRPAA